MLSVDNLFVFQLVFKSYVTPETHIERCLFWGIAGAVLLRDSLPCCLYKVQSHVYNGYSIRISPIIYIYIEEDKKRYIYIAISYLYIYAPCIYTCFHGKRSVS